MHVGLNLVFLTPGEQGGMETYVRELIPELVAAAPGHRFTSFVNRDGAAADGPWNEHTDTVVVPVSARSRVQWVRGEQQLLPPLAQAAGVDLLHSLASTAPAWGRFARVVTIHDLIYRTLPKAHPGLRSWGMRVLVPLAARRSARVITPSQATADDVVGHLGIDPGRVDAIHEGLGAARRAEPIAEAALRARLDTGARPLVLSVSAKLWHKNLEALLLALASMPAPARPVLVLPGYATAHETHLRARADQLGVGDDVRFLGWVSAAELEGLYAAALCVVFPSLAEGFGLPVLEAMARGVPVACSDIQVLREVGGDAALFFDPHRPPAIAATLRRLLDDAELRGRLATAGPRWAMRFSWRATATATLDSYTRALRAAS